MYDFWYALGTAVINPAMWAEIEKAQPKFEMLDSRTIMEVDSAGKTTVFTNRSNAGLLDPERTSAVRAAIRNFVKALPAAPPISIYTAGRFCQFMNAESFRPPMKLRAWMDGFQKAYIDAGGQTQGMSERFPALIGLCLVDREFAKLLREANTPTPAPMLTEFLDEFGVKANPGTEFQIAQKFVSTPGIRFMSDSDSGLWQTACPGDQIAFMSPQNQRAILSD